MWQDNLSSIVANNRICHPLPLRLFREKPARKIQKITQTDSSPPSISPVLKQPSAFNDFNKTELKIATFKSKI